MRKHIQTQSEWENEMSVKIINYIKSEIYLDLPYLNLALQALIPAPKEEIQTFATDGNYLFFSCQKLIELFKKNTYFLDRAYLHSILHCIFSHLWIAGERDRIIWGISCDIAVEYVIDNMNKNCTRRALTYTRQQTYEYLKGLRGISAANIYNWLEEKEETELGKLFNEFYTDDHSFWPVEEKGKAQMANETQNKWNKISRQSSMEQKRHGDEESEGSNLFAAQIKAGRSQRTYKEFLKKFSVLREELHADPDEFDLGYYTYGLSTYKNMPLIENVETRENKKINEFIIVVDTSYSTSGELIKKFLNETFTILTESDCFFDKSKIRIIQCDDKVQMDETVSTQEEIERLMHRFTVLGGGGTDFRPVFTYVNELLDTGELKEISGLLYFTDGKGIYPKKRPSYKTAFIFLDEYEENLIPPWAMHYKL